MTSSDPRGHHGLRVPIAAEGQMTYLDGPRFVVRELEGLLGHTHNATSEPGLCVTVIDRAYCCQVIRMWRTEDVEHGSISRGLRRFKIRDEAETYCGELNARVADAQAGQAPRAPLLTPAADHPSLSPFDSGCPR